VSRSWALSPFQESAVFAPRVVRPSLARTWPPRAPLRFGRAARAAASCGDLRRYAVSYADDRDMPIGQLSRAGSHRSLNPQIRRIVYMIPLRSQLGRCSAASPALPRIAIRDPASVPPGTRHGLRFRESPYVIPLRSQLGRGRAMPPRPTCASAESPIRDPASVPPGTRHGDALSADLRLRGSVHLNRTLEMASSPDAQARHGRSE
jgi:hypothetical protein